MVLETKRTKIIDHHTKMEALMNGTTANISRDTQDREHLSACSQVIKRSNHGSVGCRRCGGMLVNEQCMDIGAEGSGHRFWGMRCVQCGDIIDETILRNRYALPHALNKLRSRTRLRATVQTFGKLCA